MTSKKLVVIAALGLATVTLVLLRRSSREGAAPQDAGAQPEAAAEASAPTASLPHSGRVKLRPFDDGLPQRGQWRNAFDVADMNGDGSPDIVHGPARKGSRRPVVFLGDGRGRWKPWSEARFPDLPYDYGASAVADFNGDGKLDIALAAHLTGMTVLAGDGNGTFTSWSRGLELHAATASKTVAFSSRALAVGDWNADGRADLAAVSDGPRPDSAKGIALGLHVFQNDGKGFRDLDVAAKDTLFADSIAIGVHEQRTFIVTGSNVAGENRLLRYAGTNKAESLLLPPACVVRAVAVRDGAIAASCTHPVDGGFESGVHVLRSRRGSWEASTIFTEPGIGAFLALALGDLDGDGKVDLVVLRDDGAMRFFFGDGAGAFHPDGGMDPGSDLANCGGYHVRLVDLDGDGGNELVAAFAGESDNLDRPCRTGGAIRAWKVADTD